MIRRSRTRASCGARERFCSRAVLVFDPKVAGIKSIRSQFDCAGARFLLVREMPSFCMRK